MSIHDIRKFNSSGSLPRLSTLCLRRVPFVTAFEQILLTFGNLVVFTQGHNCKALEGRSPAGAGNVDPPDSLSIIREKWRSLVMQPDKAPYIRTYTTYATLISKLHYLLDETWKPSMVFRFGYGLIIFLQDNPFDDCITFQHMLSPDTTSDFVCLQN
jgi:hypothetical protein